MIIYAANSGYLDDVPLDKISAWEAGLYRYMDANHPEIGEAIVEKSVKGKEKMSDDLLKQMNAAIEEYKQTAAPRDDSADQARKAEETRRAAAQGANTANTTGSTMEAPAQQTNQAR
jgi:F-type H+-transporting ATPase subunit alpha